MSDTTDSNSEIPLAEGPDPKLRLRKRPPKPSSAEGQFQYQPQLKAIPGAGMGGSQASIPSQASLPVAYKRTNPFGALTPAEMLAIASAMEEELLRK